MKLSPNDPPWLKHAIGELGVLEAPGKANNQRVLTYYKEAGHPEIGADSVAWCAAFMGAMLERSGIKSTRSLMARSYRKFGKACAPKRGCIVVLERGRDQTYGHVGIFLRKVGGFVELLSGNARDSVCVALFDARSVLDYRWPDEVPAEWQTTIEVTHGQPEHPSSEADPVQPAPAPVREQSAPLKATSYEEVREKLKASGSRTIGAVDRVRSRVRQALAWLSIFGISDVTAKVADVQAAAPLLDNIWPLLVVGLIVIGIAILYDIMSVEEARVDDEVNGQQKRLA